MITYIKKIMPRTVKKKIKMVIGYWENKEYYKTIKDNKKIFILGIPTHGNLGDHAITYAMRDFVSKIKPNYQIIEVDTLDVEKHILAIKKYVNKDDIFLLNGGGNFGVEYFIEEEYRRDTIKNIKHNPIILFPQTIDFGKSEEGRKALEQTKNIYGANKNLVLIAREQTSYEMMKEYFPNNQVFLAPDIVLSLNKQGNTKSRVGAMVCMREDCESILSKDVRIRILGACQKKFKKVKVTDTVVKYNVPIKQRNKELEFKWNEFRQAELVVTDRLHGMVFAAITGTPCIVMSNYNHKVKGTYEWIKHLEYIKFINSVDKVEEAIKSFKRDLKEYTYDELAMLDKYQALRKCLKEEGV